MDKKAILKELKSIVRELKHLEQWSHQLSDKADNNEEVIVLSWKLSSVANTLRKERKSLIKFTNNSLGNKILK